MMNWTDLKNSINEWVWDNDENVYFWVLNVDEETQKIKLRGYSGLETETFYSPKRFYKNVQKVGV